MSDEVLKIIVICVTLIIIAVIVLVGSIYSAKTYYRNNTNIEYMTQALKRMQEQCNNMYARYKELTDKIDRKSN